MYGHSFARVSTALAILVMCLGARPAADEIVSIVGGTFIFDEGGNERRLDISGTKGFQADAVPLGGRFNAFDQCSSAECQPGRTVSISAAWSGNDLPGTGRIRGTTYPDLGGLDGPNSLSIGLEGSVTMPPLSDGPVTVEASFEFAGRFAFADSLEDPTQVALLAGGGTVTLVLERFPSLDSWRITRAEFQFRPLQQR